MSTGLEVAEVHAASPWIPDMVALFECYRRHYGQPGDSVEVRDWLKSQLASGGLRGFLAHRDGEPEGMALVASTPASLRLGHFWQLRGPVRSGSPPSPRRRPCAPGPRSGCGCG